MQKISIDLIRLVVSSAAICAVVGTAEYSSLHTAVHSLSPRPKSRRPFK